MPDETPVFWSARASAFVFWVALLLAGSWLRGKTSANAVRSAWTLSCALLIAHELLAMGISFAWSHAAAWEDVARQTNDVLGIAVGGGLIVNYAAVAVWSADAAWWWLRPTSYRARRPWMTISIWSFLGMMFFFGAVVFSEGSMRQVSAAMFAVAGVWVATGAMRRRERQGAADVSSAGV